MSRIIVLKLKKHWSNGVKLGEACTIVLRGATKQILDEADRSIHDALC
jgi:T-complex protein 1 subunit beta